jgi:WD40 repeat protein
VIALVDRFESAWRSPRNGHIPAIEEFYPAYLAGEGHALDAAGRQRLLEELVKLDLEYRWKGGGAGVPRWCLEEYVARLPCLGPLQELPLTLLEEEYRVRHRWGDRPGVQDYLARFPDRGQELLAALHAQENSLKAAEMRAPTVPPTVRGYEILSELGRGGMGVVYKARQVGLNRVVALKMILAGGHAGALELARFKTEAEAIARLRHANIVQVYEVGEQDGKPFFSLEFCEGGSLDRKLAGTPINPNEAASLVRALAQGMHAAHTANVIHRDLKSANVLLAGDGTPKITDFGLAKKLDEQGQTQTGAVMGTPSYMAPEQAEGKKDIGPLVDVYALGAILYECLTGRPPFKAATSFDTIFQVVSEEPVAPTQLNAKVPRDLETICLKCLQKDPAKRYANAEKLADDLHRFLAGETILARPVSAVERGWRWCSRNRVVAGLLLAVAVALLAGTAVAWALALRAGDKANEAMLARKDADRRADEADEARIALEEQLYDNHIAVAERELALNQDVGLASQLLENCPKRLRGWEWDYLMRLRDGARSPLKGHSKGLWMAAFSPDGRRIATASIDGTLRLWDAASGQSLGGWDASSGQPLRATRDRAPASAKWQLPSFGDLLSNRQPVTCLDFSPDGRYLASGSFAVNLGNLRASRGVVTVREVHTGREVFRFQEQVGIVLSVAYRRDGKHIASSSINKDNSFVVFDAKTGAKVKVVRGHASHIHRLRYSPDGLLLASASTDGVVKLWNASTLKEVRSINAHPAPVIDVAFAPDGARFATAGDDGTVRVWATATGKAVTLPLRGHTGAALGVAFSPDGKRLASAGFDKTVRLWDSASFKEKITLRGHTDTVWSVAFSPDGRRLVSASFDKEARVWDATPRQERTGPGLFSVTGHDDRVNGVAFSRDGRYLASTSWDTTVRLWDGRTGRLLHILKGHKGSTWGVAFSPNGERLASASWDHKVTVWDTATGREVSTFTGHTAPVQSVAFSPDGKRVVSGSFDGLVKIWNAATGKETATGDSFIFPVLGVAFSPDGKRVASGSGDRLVKLWDAETGDLVLILKGHEGAVTAVAFSPDGQRLVSSSWDHTLKVWDVSPAAGAGAGTGRSSRSRREVLTLRGHTDRVHGAAYSPDGKRIASCGDDKTVLVWDAVTGKVVSGPHIHRGVVWSVAFDPKGKRVAAGCWSPTSWVKTWDVAP